MIYKTLVEALQAGEPLTGKNYDNLYKEGRLGSKIVIY